MLIGLCPLACPVTTGDKTLFLGMLLKAHQDGVPAYTCLQSDTHISSSPEYLTVPEQTHLWPFAQAFLFP